MVLLPTSRFNLLVYTFSPLVLFSICFYILEIYPFLDWLSYIALFYGNMENTEYILYYTIHTEYTILSVFLTC